MARPTLLVALLGTLLLITTTSGCKTTVDIGEGGGNPRWKESCQQQMRRVNLRHCEQHVMQKIRQQQGEGGQEQNVLRFRGGIYTQDEESRDRELSEKCCGQLEKLKGQNCQCQALQQIMQRQSGQLQGKQQEQMLEQELRNLPNTCEMGPIDSCELHGKGYYKK